MGCLEGKCIVVINLLLKILEQFDFYSLKCLGLKLIGNKIKGWKFFHKNQIYAHNAFASATIGIS